MIQPPFSFSLMTRLALKCLEDLSDSFVFNRTFDISFIKIYLLNCLKDLENIGFHGIKEYSKWYGPQQAHGVIFQLKWIYN